MANACVENDYDEQSGVFTHAVIGDPSPDQVNDAVEWRNRFVTGNGFTRIIWDLTHADLSAADIKRFVLVFQNARRRISDGPGRIAIVAPSLVEFGRSRQYAAVAAQHPFEIRVFGSMPSTRRWLAED
jgi:hypothetical protein